jgi:hypothetical protein
MRKILIGTPVRLGLRAKYMAGLLPVMARAFPGVHLEHCIIESSTVNFARNEIAHYALELGADDLLFIDDDMGFTVDHFARIISHDVDIVGGIYCKRQPGRPFWLMNIMDGEEIDEATGLCRVNDIATGFMKIRTSVFRTMMKKFPEREYYNKPESGKPQTAFEFFPMGIVGPRTAEAKLERIKLCIANSKTYCPDPAELIRHMENLIDEPATPGDLRGEDYYFCHMARKCGLKIYADFGMSIIPHVGNIPFPILPDMVGLDPAAVLAKAEAP